MKNRNSVKKLTAIICTVAMILTATFTGLSATVSADGTSAVTNVSFASAEDVEAHFDSHFINEVNVPYRGENGVYSVDFADKWSVDNGVLTRKPESGGHSQNYAVLTYKDRTYKNFELEIDYTQLRGDVWHYITVGFGASKFGEFCTDDEGNMAAFVQQEGYPSFWSKGLEGEDSWIYGKSFNGNWIGQTVPNYDKTQWHHMKLVVIGDTVKMYIDGIGPSSATNFNYDGGYIYLACNTNEAQFKNLKITELPEEETYGILNEENALQNFASHKKTGGTTVASDFSDDWTLENGILRNKDESSVSTENFSILTYTPKTYNNFEMDVDYFQNQHDTWVWSFLGFGASEPGKFANDESQNMAVMIQREGAVTFRGGEQNELSHGYFGAGTFDSSFGMEESTARIINYDNQNCPTWHHLKLVVKDKVAKLYVDGNPYGFAVSNFNYEGGYVYLAVAEGCQKAMFKNLTVTELPDSQPVEGDLLSADNAAEHFAANYVSGGITTSENMWTLDNGVLSRNAQNVDSYEDNIALYTYTEKQFKNFELNVDYYQNQRNNWFWSMVGFGADKIGDFVGADTGNMAAFAQREGYPTFWGTGIVGKDGSNRKSLNSAVYGNDGGYKSNGSVKYYNNINSAEWHHLRLVVDGGNAKFYIDGAKPFVVTNFDYDGGYVYLASVGGCVNAKFKNLTITELADDKNEGILAEDNALDDFSCYFAEEGYYSDRSSDDAGFFEATKADYWSLNNGVLSRINAPEGENACSNMSVLVYDKKEYVDFELNIDYYQSPNTWKWAMVGFGATAPAEFVSESAGNTLAYADQEGHAILWSSGQEGKDGDERIYLETPNYRNWDMPMWHHMRLVVKDGTTALYIDGNPALNGTNFDYAGGYIYLAVGANEAKFKNLTITDLGTSQHDESLTDSEENFISTFANEGDADKRTSDSDGFAEIDFFEKWDIDDNGMITRQPEDADKETGNMAMLTVSQKQYKDFVLEIDYYQSPNSWKWAMIGFGAQNEYDFVNSSKNSTVAYLEQEGNSVFWGKGLFGRDSVNRIYGTRAENYNNASNPSWHHMKLVVSGGVAEFYIDNSENRSARAILSKDYNGGYIYLAAGCNEARFKNMTVTEIDSQDVVTIGDATDDGQINILDLVRMKKCLADKDEADIKAIDFDGDNDIDATDIALMCKFILAD